MDVNERLIKLTGIAITEETLQLDDEVVLEVTGSVVKVEERSKQNGTKDLIYVVKPAIVEVK